MWECKCLNQSEQTLDANANNDNGATANLWLPREKNYFIYQWATLVASTISLRGQTTENSLFFNSLLVIHIVFASTSLKSKHWEVPVFVTY